VVLSFSAGLCTVPRECFTAATRGANNLLQPFSLSTLSPKNLSARLARWPAKFRHATREIFRSRGCISRIAQQLCNPHHAIEFCGVSSGLCDAFHKVINNCVENLTRIKFVQLHFGMVRATTFATSLFDRVRFGCYIFSYALYYDGRIA
jgi:hypothetical protein